MRIAEHPKSDCASAAATPGHALDRSAGRASARGRSRAFTLIEVTLAVAICAVVLAAINGVFFAALRLRARASQAVEDLTPIDHAISVMKRDLLATLAPTGMLSGAMTTTPVTMGSGQQGGILEFFSGSGLMSDDAPWADAQKVDYYLKPPLVRSARTTGKDLVRAVTRNLLSTTQDQPEEQLLLEDVDQLQFSFYDGSQWRQVWDSSTTTMTGTNQSALPLAVQVAIQLTPSEGKVRSPVQFIVPITTRILAQGSDTNSP